VASQIRSRHLYERSGLSESEMCDPQNIGQSEWFAHPVDIQEVKEKMQAIWGAEEPEPENPLPSPPPPKTKETADAKPAGKETDKPAAKDGKEADKPPPKKADGGKAASKAALLKKHVSIPPPKMKGAGSHFSVLHDVEVVEKHNRYQMMILVGSMLTMMALYILYGHARNKTKRRVRFEYYGSTEDPLYGPVIIH